MFSNVSFRELDLNHFDTSSVIDMSLMFAYAYEINTSITIMNPKTIHEDMFVFSGGEIILNYTESTSSLVDDMINFAYESNVIKGELIN
jgi:surface protein